MLSRKHSVPLNLSAESNFPDDETIVMSFIQPNLVAHIATERCGEETPHSMDHCGECNE